MNLINQCVQAIAEEVTAIAQHARDVDLRPLRTAFGALKSAVLRDADQQFEDEESCPTQLHRRG